MKYMQLKSMSASSFSWEVSSFPIPIPRQWWPDSKAEHGRLDEAELGCGRDGRGLGAAVTAMAR